jgi:hypothetical protein
MVDEAITPKDPLAVEMGRRGGKARLSKMTTEERRRIAKLAAQARWGKKAETPTPDPNDPKGPGRDQQGAEAGIMLNSRRKPVVPVSVTSQPGSFRAAA